MKILSFSLWEVLICLGRSFFVFVRLSHTFNGYFFVTYVNKGCVTLDLAIYIKKYLKAKEELWKFKYFTMQKYNLQKNPLKETKIFQDIIIL